jgi:hypothetical protein
MISKIRLLLAAFASVLILTIAASSAAALRSFEVTPLEIRDTIRAQTFFEGGINVICEVTVNRTLNSRIAKTRGTVAGRIEFRVNTAGCVNGRVTLSSTPRTLTYESFIGTLPRAKPSFVARSVSYLVQALGGFGECLYEGNPRMTAEPSEEETEFRWDETVQLPLARNLNGLFCPEEGALRGSPRGERTVRWRLV